MKTAKYIIIGAMMTVISAPVMAQDATSAVEQATKIIKSGAEDKDKQVTSVFKTVKKDAKAVAGIGAVLVIFVEVNRHIGEIEKSIHLAILWVVRHSPRL